LNPKWIASEIMNIPTGTSIPMELGLGPSISVRSKIADLVFIPSSERLIVNPSKEDEELFKHTDEAITRLYNLLPYTPIEAIGYNFQYELEENEDFTIDIDFQASRYNEIYKNIGASAGTESAILHSLALHDDAYVVLNLQLKISGKRKLLSFNYHYQINYSKEKIQKSLNKFYNNYKHSQTVAQSIIKEVT
jgi:hypothetical protein